MRSPGARNRIPQEHGHPSRLERRNRLDQPARQRRRHLRTARRARADAVRRSARARARRASARRTAGAARRKLLHLGENVVSKRAGRALGIADRPRRTSTFSSTVGPGSAGGPPAYSRSRPARSCGGTARRSLPRNVTVPERTGRSPMIERMGVVLPAPLRRRGPTKEPGAIGRTTSVSTGDPAISTDRWAMSSAPLTYALLPAAGDAVPLRRRSAARWRPRARRPALRPAMTLPS